MTHNIPLHIAIDGTAASGKSTVGKILAKQLDYLFFDTGVMYRVVAFAALNQFGAVSDESLVTQLAETLDFGLFADAQTGETRSLLNGVDITEKLHLPEVDRNVSLIAAYPGVRYALTAIQRNIGLKGRVVMVGRDIGTVVMPDADLKVYLIASAETRASRRYAENVQKGVESDYAEILNDIRMRDLLDSTRTIAPLIAAEDAFMIQTDTLGVAQVAEIILKQILD